MFELQGFIFDLDGVIVDTVDLHFRAWQQMFGELGISYDRADRDRFRGVHQRQILLTKARDLSEAQIAYYLALKDSVYRRLLAEARHEILLTPVLALLHEARAQHLKIGLASSSTNARHVLDLVGLRALFDAIADGHTVCRNKPAPDIFVWVAGALGLNPGAIAVVEDGSAGVEAARTAGMFTVGINVAAAHLNVTLESLDFGAIFAAYLKLHPLPASAGD